LGFVVGRVIWVSISEGIIVLDKPVGISSARAVSRVKRLLEKGTKIGHAGTLDPFATGVLLLLVGKATKLCEKLMDGQKVYEATIKLGANTATDDPESAELVREGFARPSEEEIRGAVGKFVGVISQRPPKFSAMKVGGRRAYKLAREGKAVALAARDVRVDGIEVLEIGWPLVKVRVVCGRGTYIRALARDLGEVLGTGGYLTELKRTRIGEFDLAQGVTLEQLTAAGVGKYLIAIGQ
jgi:tRNA pseudouridine55 synthase